MSSLVCIAEIMDDYTHQSSNGLPFNTHIFPHRLKGLKKWKIRKEQELTSMHPLSQQPLSAPTLRSTNRSPSPQRLQRSVQERAHKDAPTTRRFSEPPLKAQESLGKGRRSSMDPSEALKRGRRFEPLLKTGTRQDSLKASDEASISIRNLAAQEGDGSSNGKQDNMAGEPDILSLHEDTADSSDDDDETRGRKRTVDDCETYSESPAVTATPQAGGKTTSKRFNVKPKTDSDHSASRERPVNPTTADIENLEEIRKAQRLSVAVSTTDIPESHKVIRTIMRGDYAYFQNQAREGNLRVRTYLLAVDLRPEAAYAMEWAIGTVLRDGDTLMAIFAVDKAAETGYAEDGVPIEEGEKAMQETAVEVDKVTAESQRSSRLFDMKTLLSGSRRSSVAAEARIFKRSKKQQERMHALEKLSDLCVDLLRKTKLQVRVVIEVIHCKVARYMLTEAIDVLQPTLVIVGSRGRSVMKGALAGSISRYLIMKSSVPVMTARMKLSSRKVKTPPPKIRLGNNLIPSKRFADVKIDELESRLSRKTGDDNSTRHLRHVFTSPSTKGTRTDWDDFVISTALKAIVTTGVSRELVGTEFFVAISKQIFEDIPHMTMFVLSQLQALFTVAVHLVPHTIPTSESRIYLFNAHSRALSAPDAKQLDRLFAMAMGPRAGYSGAYKETPKPPPARVSPTCSG
ncbi:MAG: hypothetical protein Q9163_001388 [Psora crenata]